VTPVLPAVARGVTAPVLTAAVSMTLITALITLMTAALSEGGNEQYTDYTCPQHDILKNKSVGGARQGTVLF